MARCRVDPSIERKRSGGFAFPLGVYPLEPVEPTEGYTLSFEQSDSGEDLSSPTGDEWEEWPDRYVFDALVSSDRVEGLVRMLMTLFPGRVYPILDVLGHDEYREVDPFVSYELVGQERVADSIRRYRDFFFEDGLVGFGLMSEDPFMYVFVDEHKFVTVRVESEARGRVEELLGAFDLDERPELVGVDSVTHEHRGVLMAPEERADLLSAEEIVEDLKDEWGLVLNVDTEHNVDDEGNELGLTGWRCVVRCEPVLEEEEVERGTLTQARYAEVLLTASSLGEAEDLAWEASQDLLEQHPGGEGLEAVVVSADRMRPEHFRETASRVIGAEPELSGEGRVWHAAMFE